MRTLWRVQNLHQGRTSDSCEDCGCIIPLPVPAFGKVLCDVCSGDRDKRMRKTYHSRESGEGADRRYHGDLFERGEW